MKKSAIVGAVALVSLLVVGCSSSPSPGGGAAASVFADGTYTAFSDANDKGYGKATVTIEGDQIVAVELAEFTGLGAQKDFATYPYEEAGQANAELPAKFIEKNGPDVDNFSGATSSTKKYSEAVARALELAKVEQAGGTYFDGTFMGISEANQRGQMAIVWVTIENDAITAVTLEQTADDSGVFKGEDYSYEEFFPAKEEMAARFVAANSADVDTFSGATSSSNQWIEAVNDALAKAKK